MDNIASIIIFLSSAMNTLIALYLAYKILSRKGYLENQLGYFFILFGLYFTVSNIIINTLSDQIYLFSVLLELSGFILYLSLGFLFSAFMFIKRKHIVPAIFFVFLLLGLIISLLGIFTINPSVNSIGQSSVYLFSNYLSVIKIAFLTFSFLYPAIIFIKKSVSIKEYFVTERYYLLAVAFVSWLAGSILNSQYQNKIFLLLGNIALLIGFTFAGFVFLEKGQED